MKPYEIEIFDRQFNFLFNALVDEKNFSYNFDAISPEKNSIIVPKSFKPTEISNDPRAPKGWYVRIFRDSEEYQGVITGFDEKETQGVIEYSQLLTLFDYEIPIISQEVTQGSIESYINTILTSTFITASDEIQRIPNLSITATGNTSGSLPYCDTDDLYTAINILNDLIVPAYTAYGIYTKVTIGFESKTIDVTINVLSNDAITIEGDLPNICDSNFVIKKQDGKEINKIIIRDTHFSTDYVYFLYSDGTYGTNPTPTGKVRIYPAVSQVILFDVYELAKGLVDASYQEKIELITNYSQYPGTIPDSVWSSFYSACSDLMQKYMAIFDISQYEYDFDKYAKKIDEEPWLQYVLVDFVQDSVDSFGSNTEIEKTRHYYPAFGQDNKKIMYGYDYDTQYNFYGHAAIHIQGEVFGQRRNTPTSTIWIDVEEWQHNYILFGETLAKSAFSAYQNTAEYAAEVLAKVSSQEVRENIESKASYAFSANKYTNLIELTVKPDDSMIKPLAMNMGQTANIIHDGVSYNSILSGREIQKDGLVKLIFGTIRLELTKILNMKGI